MPVTAVDFVMDRPDTTDLFVRARSAIVEAHRLSTSLQEVTRSPLGAEPDVAVGSSEMEIHATQPESTTTSSYDVSDVLEADMQHEFALSTGSKLVTVAQRLSRLRDEHESTLCHLMDLRLQQVQLRRQQLAALHGLLSQHLSRLGAPVEAPLARTRTAITSALSLLVECSLDLEGLAVDVGSDDASRRAVLVQTVDAADQRADNVSSLARRLLEILANQAAAESTQSWVTGLQQDRIDRMPWYLCTESMLERLSSSECPICLHPFCVGERLSSLPCRHVHHHTCLSEWLHIRASCPICKAPYPDSNYSLPGQHVETQEGSRNHTEESASASPPL